MRNGMAKMAEKIADYILEDKPVLKYERVEIAGNRLLKIAIVALQSNNVNKYMKMEYEV